MMKCIQSLNQSFFYYWMKCQQIIMMMLFRTKRGKMKRIWRHHRRLISGDIVGVVRKDVVTFSVHYQFPVATSITISISGSYSLSLSS